MNKMMMSVKDLKLNFGGPCGHIRSRLNMAARFAEIKLSKRYLHYTTSQLMELLSARGNVTFKMENRPDVKLEKGKLMEIGALLSTVQNGKEFQLVFSHSTEPTLTSEDTLTSTIHVTACNFVKMTANTLRSKSNLGELFEIHRVPLFESQRKSLGLDLK